MDETNLVNQMANFFMNKIHEISDAVESYDKFKPGERNMDDTLERFGEMEIEEIRNY